MALYLLQIHRSRRKIEHDGESFSGPLSEFESVFDLIEIFRSFNESIVISMVMQVVHLAMQRCKCFRTPSTSSMISYCLLLMHLGMIFLYPPRQKFAALAFRMFDGLP
jgi:hypothetical protein